ncbi:MAG TPA: hypothetical protein VH370_21625 [Humisphaera sp.]|jgi:hypothetical protein|nr:hypothetical protein [Humisphaera sp.]
MEKRLRLALPLLILLVAGGCTNAVQSGRNTALDSMDLTQMTDQMAASISASPKVQAAIARTGPLKIVVQPVQNEMTAEVLPRGQADAFTGRVRDLLSKQAHDKFIWIMNRDAFYALRQRELEVDLGPSPEAINPDYALTARFLTLTHETSKMRTSAYLCVFELTNLNDRTLLWSDKYEVKKTAVKEFLD